MKVGAILKYQEKHNPKPTSILFRYRSENQQARYLYLVLVNKIYTIYGVVKQKP